MRLKKLSHPGVRALPIPGERFIISPQVGGVSTPPPVGEGFYPLSLGSHPLQYLTVQSLYLGGN